MCVCVCVHMQIWLNIKLQLIRYVILAHLEALNGDSYPGEHSRKVGLTVACLLDEGEGELPQLTCLTKGIVYKLSLLRKA